MPPAVVVVFEAIAIRVLEVLGVLAVAAGSTLGLLPLIGWSSLSVGGLVAIGGVVLSSVLSTPRKAGGR